MKTAKILLGLFLSGAVASATSFDFTYNFNDGTIVRTTFDGTLSGVLITDITNATATFNGTITSPPIFVMSAHKATGGYSDVGAIASTDGSELNLYFADVDVAATGSQAGLTTQLLLETPGGVFFHGESVYQFPGKGGSSHINNSWRVTGTPRPDPLPPTVPDAGVTAAMIGLALAGIISLRRKANLFRAIV